MKSTICYDNELMAALRNPDEAAEYLNAALAPADALAGIGGIC